MHITHKEVRHVQIHWRKHAPGVAALTALMTMWPKSALNSVHLQSHCSRIRCVSCSTRCTRLTHSVAMQHRQRFDKARAALAEIP